MTAQPFLSVILSTRNHRNFLPGCLMGILQQTWKDFEFLIADDGSTDDTWSCLENWAQRDRRIQLLRRKQSMGVIDSYNALFCKARGDYLWSVATDDHCINEIFLQEGFEMLKRYPQAAGFYSAMNVVKMPGEFFDKQWTAGNRNRYLSPDKIMRLFWRDEGYPCGPSIVLRKTWYERFRGWPKELGPQCDCFLNVVAGGNSGMAYLGKPSVVHRIWQDGSSFTSSQAKKDLFGCLAQMESLLRLNLPAHLKNSSSWERWRIDAILRTLNTKHEYKVLLKEKRRFFLKHWFPTIRDLYRGVSLYFFALSPSLIVKNFNLAQIKNRQIIFARKIWNKVKFDYQVRLFFRFLRYLKKRF